jgi:predicted ATPase
MITSIEYQNYKAFEKANIPVKPITILLGANSVGKSSIVQSLLMFQQTGKAGLKSYKSALKLYGGYVNFGEPLNLYRKKNTTKPLSFTFELKSKELKDYFQEYLISSFVRVFAEIPYYLPFKGFSEIRDSEIGNVNDFEKLIDALISFLSKKTTQDRYQKEVRFFLSHRHEISIPGISKQNRSEIIAIYRFLYSLKKNIKNELFTIQFELKINKQGNLEIEKLKVSHEKNVLFEFLNNGEIDIKSDLIKFSEKEKSELDSIFDKNNTIFNCFKIDRENLKNISVKINVVAQMMQKAQLELQKEFSENNINYVSPLRAHPKRYYMLDKAKLNLTLDTLDGDAIAEVLKDNKSLTKKVNNWLTKFGIEVDVKEFKEVIHHLIVKQNNLDLDITDVGFGISQILPVIIQGFLSAKNSTTIIEQPEIHLHPKIQADLADLFIDIIKVSTNRRLIIETHSEYILKRLRRRISEGKISPDKVAICLFSPQSEDKGAEVEELKIEEQGYFEWPEEFYGGELYRDTTEFLVNQK